MTEAAFKFGAGAPGLYFQYGELAVVDAGILGGENIRSVVSVDIRTCGVGCMEVSVKDDEDEEPTLGGCISDAQAHALFDLLGQALGRSFQPSKFKGDDDEQV